MFGTAKKTRENATLKMKKTLSIFMSVLFLLIAANLSLARATLDDVSILGFSEQGDMVFYANEEIVWLTKNSAEPSKTMPCEKAYFTPGATYIYFEIDGKLMASDFNQDSVAQIPTSIEKVEHIDAFGKWLIVQNGSRSEFFYDLNLIKKEQGLWSFTSSKNKQIIAENNVGNGCVSLTNSGQMQGISVGTGTYHITNEGILCVGENGATHYSYDFTKSQGLPRMDSYKVESGHIIGTKDGSNYFISPSGSLVKMPEFTSFIALNDIICGITQDKLYKALSLPSLEELPMPEIKIESSWHVFKPYKNFVVIESEAPQCLIIGSHNGMPLFYTPGKSSAGLNQVLYQEGENLLIHKLDGSLVRLDIKAAAQMSKDSPNPKIINTSGSRTTILYTSGDNAWRLARINTDTGETIQNIPVTKSGATIICTPKDSPFLTRANPSESIESWTFERLHEDGFLNSTSLFVNSNPKSVLVVSPRNGEILEFACTEF